jgi:hypothetical protein
MNKEEIAKQENTLKLLRELDKQWFAEAQGKIGVFGTSYQMTREIPTTYKYRIFVVRTVCGYPPDYLPSWELHTANDTELIHYLYKSADDLAQTIASYEAIK